MVPLPAAEAPSAAQISTWGALRSALAKGETATLTLAASFGGYDGKQIEIKTAVAIEGNSVTIDARGYHDRFFALDQGVHLELSHVTLKNGLGLNGGAIYVSGGGTVSLTSCSFSGNLAVSGWDRLGWRACDDAAIGLTRMHARCLHVGSP